MKQIKIFCIHSFCKDVASLKNYFRLDFPDIKFVWDELNPDYLIATDNIYTNRHCFEKFKALYHKAKIRIMYAVEAMSPDFNLFDYAVGFDSNLNNGDRFIQQLPPFRMYKGFLTIEENNIISIDEALRELHVKKGFCNFLYSNWKANIIRDELFYALSSYKKVDSLGKHLNNVGVRGSGWYGHSSDCIAIKSPYKFSIACENASFAGYTSEKIFTSLIAHNVPIYWGDPTIVKNVNPDCFVNVNNYTSMDDLLEEIKRIDEDNELWAKMVASPWRTKEQVSYHNNREEEYKQFFYKLFSQDLEKAKRIGEGTYPNISRTFIFSATPSNNSIIGLILDKYRALQYDKQLKIKYSKPINKIAL